MTSRKLIVMIGALLLVASSISVRWADAQTPNTRLAWDQTAPDLATAQSFTYKFYRNGATAGTVVTSVVCTPAVATSPVGTFPCNAPFPSSTPGVKHSITLSATSPAGESPVSAPYVFTLTMIPAAPLNLRGQ
jgi:hypothetical protein